VIAARQTKIPEETLINGITRLAKENIPLAKIIRILRQQFGEDLIKNLEARRHKDVFIGTTAIKEIVFAERDPFVNALTSAEMKNEPRKASKKIAGKKKTPEHIKRIVKRLGKNKKLSSAQIVKIIENGTGIKISIESVIRLRQKKANPMSKRKFWSLSILPEEKKRKLWKLYIKAFLETKSRRISAITYIVAANKLYNKKNSNYSLIAREMKQTGLEISAPTIASIKKLIIN
jgi:hypothetical protein